jgi:hypothetical protein
VGTTYVPYDPSVETPDEGGANGRLRGIQFVGESSPAECRWPFLGPAESLRPDLWLIHVNCPVSIFEASFSSPRAPTATTWRDTRSCVVISCGAGVGRTCLAAASGRCHRADNWSTDGGPAPLVGAGGLAQARRCDVDPPGRIVPAQGQHRRRTPGSGCRQASARTRTPMSPQGSRRRTSPR